MVFLDKEHIAKKYETLDSIWGSKPNNYVVEALSIMPKGNVLDIGVGEGRNALFLAERGHVVTGIDIVPLAIEKFMQHASKKGVTVRGIKTNIENFVFDQKYDVIISNATLHFVKKESIHDIINRMKDHTKDNGVHVITVFSNKDSGFKEFPHLHFFEESELLELYKDWQILKYEPYTKYETHDEPHTHHLLALIAVNRRQ